MAYVRQFLRVGDLAFYDSTIGPIPCRVVRIKHDQGKHGTFGASSDVRVRVVLTAPRPGFSRGDTVDSWSLRVIPRKSLRRNRIMPYDVVVPEQQP